MPQVQSASTGQRYRPKVQISKIYLIWGMIRTGIIHYRRSQS